MKMRYANIAGGLFALVVAAATPAARAAEPGISAEASAAVQQMGKTLSAADLSFQVRTIRVYQDNDGQPLHIFHAMKVVAHRPDRLAVRVTGDDGSNELIYDGRTVAIFNPSQNKYAKIPAPNNIDATLEEVVGRLHADFPLTDFFDKAPDKSFLSGVTSGREIGTVPIDGKPHRHLFFSQTGGIELELWVEKTEQAAPRRLIVTYRLMPGQPNFIAEFSDWNFGTRAAESEFAFQPPAGATQIELKP